MGNDLRPKPGLDTARIAETNAPWMLLIRNALFGTAGAFLEKALLRRCNVITFYEDGMNVLYLTGRSHLGRLSRWLTGRLSLDFVDRRLRFAGIKRLDGILVVDPVRTAFDFSSLGAPTSYYALDPHVWFPEHARRVQLTRYDIVFAAQKDHISRYREAGCPRVLWLPPAADPEIHAPVTTERLFDLCFVGHLDSPSRSLLVDEVRKRLEKRKLFIGTAFLHDLAFKYSQSNIILNKSISGDINMRVFEAMSCGRMLLTDRIGNGLGELFEDRKHLVTYSGIDDLVDLFNYYIANGEEREEIALTGRRKVLAEHTYDQRADFILRSIGIAES